MSKPDDIPQDVWDNGTDTFDKILCNSGYEGARDDAIADLCRAIIAAKAEERAACLLIIAREQFDRRAQSDDEPVKAKRMALNSMAYVCDLLMEAISQRAEVNTAHKNSEG